MSGRRAARRLRVLLIAAGNTTTGGGEKHVADLVRSLPLAGFDVALACPHGGDLGGLARGLGVPVCNVPIDCGFSPGRVRAVRAAITAAAPDVVHAHGSRAAAFARLGDPHAAQRVVYTVHGIHVDKAGSPLRRIVFTGIERLLRPRTARFVTVCKADAIRGAHLGLLAATRTTAIHNGIELPPRAAPAGRFRAELGVGAHVPLVLSVGRFHEQKDQETLLRAWRIVVGSHPDAVLAIVGAGGLAGRLRELAAADCTSGSVRLVRPRAALAEAYVDADAFALSSRWEGLPYVLLEAMAYGLPVASTNVDGIPEAVVDGVTGVLVPPEDPIALGRALEGLLSDPARRRRMGEAGRERVTAEFSLDQMIARITQVYRELAGPRRTAAARHRDPS
jgi:glycosyltransferase involved in cell wall biosynthesis